MRVGFKKDFRKRYKKITVKIRLQFDERFRLFMKDPYNPVLNNHPLTGDRAGQWSIDVTGDWRAIYIFKDNSTVVFIDINTHSNLYK